MVGKFITEKPRASSLETNSKDCSFALVISTVEIVGIFISKDQINFLN